MATASLARARRSTELSLVVMAGMITAIAYTFASLGQYTQIPARIIPFLLTLLGLLLLAHLAVPVRPAPIRRCSPSSPCSTASAT